MTTVAQDWITTLPEEPCEERSRMTIEAVKSGLAVIEFADITSTYKEHTATFRISKDAAYIDTEDGRFRFQVSAKTAQICAEELKCMLPTDKLMDIRHLSSNKLDATLLTAGKNMSSTIYSLDFNKKLNDKITSYDTIISDIGKPWINSNKLAYSKGACLYGFFDTKAPFHNSIGLNLWQDVGTKHNILHEDYSSTLILVQQTCNLDGQEVEIKDIISDKTLSYLLNYDGILKYTKGSK